MSRFVPRIAGNRMALIGLGLLALIVLLALLAPLIVADPAQFDVARRLMPPSSAAPFGTDRMGGDIFSSVVFGARVTLLIATATVATGILIGVPIGLVAGYFHNWISDALMRVSDIALAVPQIVLAIAITQTLGPSVKSVVVALSLTYWPFWTRLVYAETRSMRNEIYIESAVALGASPWRIMILHILPAIASSIVVRSSIGVGGTILAAATLGFLGLGAPPPTPEWGRIIAESRDYLPEAWWYPLAPGMAIFLTVLGCYLFGDGLRDALDPRTSTARR
ncbi:ABC transporter permease [Mesorhizobium sp. CN2-181]|uniref:ABC transporter permease n=1 Tax=Mesorhizobium yinganensis TaxID=3157707 RepID=UPI0032B83B26